jgi:hypothetical protein
MVSAFSSCLNQMVAQNCGQYLHAPWCLLTFECCNRLETLQFPPFAIHFMTL